MYKLEEQKPNMFEFEYKGKKHEIPAIDSLPVSTFMRIRKKMNESVGADEAGFDEIMGLFEQYAPDVMAEIILSQAKELIVAYSASGSSNLGE